MSEARETVAAEAPQPALQPGEQQHDITDDRSAGVALEGLLDFDESGNLESAPEDAGEDAGPDESPATGSEEGATEPPATAAIEAPESWSAEDKAVFAKLPPEARAVIARRESERDSYVTTRTREIATERQSWDAERAAISTQREQYLQSLQQLTALALPEAKQFEGINWAQLAVENPAEWVRLSGLREGVVGRVAALQNEIRTITEQSQAEQQQRMQSFLGEQRKALIEKHPELADPAKGPAIVGEMRTWLGSNGFSAAEIDGVVDHRLVALALKAMRLENADKARATAATKTQNTPPRVQQPGAASAPDEGGRVRGLIGNLGRTNSVRDAGRLLQELL